MRSVVRRGVFVGIAALAAAGISSVVAPAVGAAAECGVGTVYDAASNTCVVAQPAPAPLPPPPPPPPPPVWNGDLTPYFSVGVCAPVPFISVCAGI